MYGELQSNSYYQDDVGGVYLYTTQGIHILSYPPRPSLRGSFVAQDDPRHEPMVSNLFARGTLLAGASVANDLIASQSPPAPAPGTLPDAGGQPAGSGGATTPIYLESWFPWVVGGVVVTVAAGLAIVFWPTADSAKSEEDENED